MASVKRAILTALFDVLDWVSVEKRTHNRDEDWCIHKGFFGVSESCGLVLSGVGGGTNANVSVMSGNL